MTFSPSTTLNSVSSHPIAHDLTLANLPNPLENPTSRYRRLSQEQMHAWPKSQLMTGFLTLGSMMGVGSVRHYCVTHQPYCSEDEGGMHFMVAFFIFCSLLNGAAFCYSTQKHRQEAWTNQKVRHLRERVVAGEFSFNLNQKMVKYGVVSKKTYKKWARINEKIYQVSGRINPLMAEQEENLQRLEGLKSQFNNFRPTLLADLPDLDQASSESASSDSLGDV